MKEVKVPTKEEREQWIKDYYKRMRESGNEQYPDDNDFNDYDDDADDGDEDSGDSQQTAERTTNVSPEEPQKKKSPDTQFKLPFDEN